MATSSLSRNTPQRSSLAPPREEVPCSDGHLLDRFLQDKDEGAFEELVRRHSAMVLGVCRRVLHNPHDAEDCFQAVFLVLVRKATTIRPREMVGNWLYGVAYRTALEARKLAARRRVMERKKSEMPSPESVKELWHELRPLLDQELSKLPDKYRIVLLACDLQGKTRQETALALGVPDGTVASRLARGRVLLAKRLKRQSVSFSEDTLALVLPASGRKASSELLANTVSAGLQLASGKSLVGHASPAVIALSDNVVGALLLSKLKVAGAAALALVLLALGAATFIAPAKAERQEPLEEFAAFEKTERIHGCLLQKIDLANKTIQATKYDVADRGDTALYELQVQPNTVIFIDGEAASLEDLSVGASIDLDFQRGFGGIKKALRLDARSRDVGGMVLALSDTSVTLQHEENGKPESIEKAYDVEKTAAVVINGKKAKLSDLKIKMKVTMRMAAKKQHVVSIEAVGPSVDGVVKDIDVNKHAISVAVTSTHLVAEGISVATDAPVIIDGRKGKLTDLRAGMRVTLQMSAETDPGTIVGIRSAASPRKQ